MPCTPMVVCPAVTGYWCATPAVVAVTKASGEKLATPLPAAFQPSNCNAIGAGSCDDIPTESGASFIARPLSPACCCNTLTGASWTLLILGVPNEPRCGESVCRVYRMFQRLG